MELKRGRELAEYYFAKHGLKGWSFIYDNAKIRFGACHCGYKRIKISMPLTILNSEAAFLDTLLHEIAHALTPNQNHNKIWKRKAIEIGASGQRCYEASTITKAPGKYVYICKTCNKEFIRYRRKRTRSACTACCKKYNRGRFSEDHLIVLKKG